ncbi:putative pre-rRNA-processing protein las1 [Heracleum sosnowskyi]|uniref:Pre-rRNA-processing protein las1 n=1 Tax=Heracleum sosnowskyi TaxID=360622 RepID=A0AAD8HTB6_9APIA|nr:putative pre-rRNA-processing protein las1 [Heracleum sosnowskyi]
MDSILGFTLPNDTVSVPGDDIFSGTKLVPWISWDDWRFVKDGLFSSSPNSIASSLRRVSAWRSRGCIPVVVQVTASIIEIQHSDPFFRDDVSDNLLHSEEMLAMLYSMAIMRLVNGVVEKTRKKTEVSIGEAADALGIPRMLIDVRHECSHRDLPSLRLVRLASLKALEWLKSYYWEPQTLAIPSDQSNVRKEIKSVLRELFLSINMKQTHQPNSSMDKEKRVKYSKNPFGRNKILSLKARKISLKPAGPKKHISKMLKSFSRLYSSFSPEVVSVLLRLLLKASDSADLGEVVKNCNSQSASSLQTALDDWKPVIVKLLDREPELLVTLFRGILDMIETLESGNYNFVILDFETKLDMIKSLESGNYNFGLLSGAELYKSVEAVSQIEQLSHLFEWLVFSCKGLRLVEDKESAVKTSSSTELVLSNTTLVEYLHRCLKLSSGNNQLMKSALVIAHMTGNSNLTSKLKKLALINNLTLYNVDENLPSVTSGSYLSQQEDDLRKAAEKLEGFKQQHVKDIDANATDGHVGTRSVWVVAKSWNSCSIGMLPPALGSSAHLPVLDGDEYHEELKTSSGIKELPELNHCDGKREADCSLANLDSSCCKKMGGSGAGLESEDDETQSLEGEHGHLMLSGVWKKVREEEILEIASDIRILV